MKVQCFHFLNYKKIHSVSTFKVYTVDFYYTKIGVVENSINAKMTRAKEIIYKTKQLDNFHTYFYILSWLLCVNVFVVVLIYDFCHRSNTFNHYSANLNNGKNKYDKKEKFANFQKITRSKEIIHETFMMFNTYYVTFICWNICFGLDSTFGL